jgi:hypothetical protein
MDIHLPLAFVCVLVAASARADFHDQGMRLKPAVKTEYVDPKTGTAGEPLVIGTCLWGNCRTERLVYQQSNAWQQNLACDPCTGPPKPDSYWVALFNNEPRADPHNSGPPDASLPRAAAGAGLMGFQTLRGASPADRQWRAHLVLDFVAYSNPVFGGIPFLGFGEFSNRGNRNRPLGYLQPSSSAEPSVLSFGERLWRAIPPVPIAGTTQPATLASYVWVLANWGTKPKAIFVTLYHYNIQNSVPPGDPAINHFNWPITQSALYPGAEIVYIDAEDMAYYCGFDLPLLAPQQDIAYRIDLTALFACVSKRNLFTEPLPSTADIPVTQVLWANESSGVDGALWIDVHGQQMLPTGSVAVSASPAPAKTVARPDGQTDAIRRELDRQCHAIPGCADRAALAAAGNESRLELPADRQPTRPALLQALPLAPPSSHQNP